MTGVTKFMRYSTESPAKTSTNKTSIEQFVYIIASETGNLNFYRIPFGS